MHRSRLCMMVLDCPEATFEGGIEFWRRALGAELHPQNKPGERYAGLIGGPAGTRVLLQRTTEPSAVHLDIETDDVEAEVARLEALGATRKYKVKTWWVMRAPTGHDFCVVRPQLPDFPGDATTWE